MAAESAAESANQAEAAADAAETAAELLQGRVDADEGIDPEATAAMSARMDAGGFEESFADRLAFLMPSHGEGDADGAPRTTQVIVSGLVSVASIASFKRHLGRLPGVQARGRCLRARRASSCSTSPTDRTSRSGTPSRPCPASRPA